MTHSDVGLLAGSLHGDAGVLVRTREPLDGAPRGFDHVVRVAHRRSASFADDAGQEPRALELGAGALPYLAGGLLLVLGEAYLEELVERAVVQTAVRELLMDPVGLGDGAAARVSRCVDLTIPYRAGF
jgi:hypothetical protein